MTRADKVAALLLFLALFGLSFAVVWAIDMRAGTLKALTVKTSDQIVEQALDTNVELQTSPFHSCSGTVINRHMILSAAHCFEMSVKRYGGTLPVNAAFQFESRVGMLAAFDMNRDLAVVYFEDELPTAGAKLRPPSQPLKHLEDIYVVGNPYLGAPYTIHKGVVSNLDYTWYDGQRNPRFQIDAGVSQGFSGGAVLDRFGQLVGVLSAYAGLGNVKDKEGKLIGSQHLYHIGFAMKPETIRSFFLEYCTDSNCSDIKEKVITHGH